MQGIHQFAVRHSQRGVTLVVGMIMLVLITLLVLAGFHLGRNNLDIVGNAQQRNDALGAAQQTIEAAVNSRLLTATPGSVFPTPCSGWPDNTLCYDVNGDGTADIIWADTSNDVQIWQMSAGQIAQFVFPSGHDGPEWHLKGVGDFTGDGRADLLWLGGAGGAQIWDVNGTQVTVLQPTAPPTVFNF